MTARMDEPVAAPVPLRYLDSQEPVDGGPADPQDPPVGHGHNGACVTLRVGSSLAEAERALILATLEHFGQHRQRAAAVLGISLRTLYSRLDSYGKLPRPRR